jgi:DNA-binding CsgD family transcriptional regulator
MASRSGREERLSGLIGYVYDAAIDPALWAGVGPRVARTLDSPSSALFVKDPHGTRWVSRTANFSDDFARDYERYYHRVDVRANGLAARAMGKVFVGRELIADADLLRTEFYQDYARKTQSFRLVGSVFAIGDGLVGVLGVHRPEGAAAYTGEDKQDIRMFLPHLTRALQMRRRLASAGLERGAALEALERTGMATLVVAADGHVLFASRDAERLLGDGEALRLAEGKLVARTPREAARLAGAIRDAADIAAGGNGAAGQALNLERPDRAPLGVLVAPLRPALDGFGMALPAALVFVRDPERLDVAGELLQGLFELTAMEARIAAALCRGRSMADITRAQGISINTAKTHLKAILLKTGTRRQAELVALLLRSVAVTGAGPAG